MRFPLFAIVLLLSAGATRVAEARGNRFAGAHPVAAKLGGGYCYIESPHVHAYAPDHAPLYQQVGDHYVFTGDPTPFGYEGDKHSYYGHHPVVSVNGQPVYCYLDGPHSHAIPPGDEGWKKKKGVAFYVGPFDPVYAQQRPQRVRAVNAEYRPYAAFRPQVQVEPPEGYTGDVYVAPPAVEVGLGAPSVVVSPPQPRVVVAPPSPTLVVGAPQPRVVVAPPSPTLYVAPPPRVVVAPPAPHVYVGGGPRVVVGAPAPHIVVGGPRVVVGAPAPGVVYKYKKGKRGHGGDDDGDDDDDRGRGRGRGKHKGWYK